MLSYLHRPSEPLAGMEGTMQQIFALIGNRSLRELKLELHSAYLAGARKARLRGDHASAAAYLDFAASARRMIAAGAR